MWIILCCSWIARALRPHIEKNCKSKKRNPTAAGWKNSPVSLRDAGERIEGDGLFGLISGVDGLHGLL